MLEGIYNVIHIDNKWTKYSTGRDAIDAALNAINHNMLCLVC